MKPGPASQLNKEVLSRIKKLVIEGKTLVEIAKVIDIPYSTVTNWTCFNVEKLSDKIEGWKRDRKLKLAEDKLERILEMNHDEKDTLKVQADIAKFTAETLGKKHYAKRNEVTGEDGKPQEHNINGFNFIRNEEDNTDNKTDS